MLYGISLVAMRSLYVQYAITKRKTLDDLGKRETTNDGNLGIIECLLLSNGQRCAVLEKESKREVSTCFFMQNEIMEAIGDITDNYKQKEI